MTYRATVHGRRFAFGDLRELLARADEWKSGDEFAGIAADGERERVGASGLLATRASGVSALLAGHHAKRIEP